MTTGDVSTLVDRFKGELAKILELEDVASLDINRPLAQFGLDSIREMEICSLLENTYDIIIPVESFLDNPSANDLLQQILQTVNPSLSKVSA